MSGNSATSTLDIVLKDDVSSAAKAVAASLEKVQAEAKSVDEALARSGTRDGLQTRLKSLGASKAQIEGAAKAWADYAKAEGLAVGKSGEWSAKQIAGVKNWENVTVASLRAIRGEERAREFAEIASSRKMAEQAERDHRRRMQMAAQEAAARQRHVEHLAETRAHGEAHHGVRNYLLQSAALAVSAHGIMSVIENAVEQGAEYQHRLVALRNSGRSEAEIAQMQAASHAALRGAPTATLTGNLEVLNETVGAFGSVEHAIEHLGFMNKAATVLHAVAGDKIGGSAGEMGNQLARFFEMRGTAGNGAVFEREASEMMKSMIFTGGNVNPRELLNFAQQAKSSLQNYSIEFLSRIAPSLIGEVGGDRAGTQANAFNSVILGKANDAKQAAAWVKYGLIDPKQMTGKGDQKTGWTGGAIYNTDEFLKNPLQAIEDHLLPKLAAKGVNINDPLALTKVLGTLFRNINAAAFANELANPQNRARLHKDAGLTGQVEDPEAIYRRLLATDPTVALHALKGSLENLLTTVTSPLMTTAAGSMSGMAENLNELAIAAHDHPFAAVATGLAAATGALATAGTLSYKLLNGFGSATFGPAAGEMMAAGHEQLAAGRLMLSAAEGGALEHDLPGVVPGLRKKVGGAVVREGENLAEGAAEAAIGGKVVSAIESGLKGGLSVGALEVAATAGVTLSAGTVAFVGLSAAAIIGALKASTEPKHRASDDPGFGRAFAPTGAIDYNDPKYRDPDGMTDEEKKDAGKWWFNRGKGTPRGSVQSQKDTDLPGHWVDGPHGMKHWALEDRDRILKNAPFFSTAPLGPDGLPTVPMPAGLPADPYDRRTWAHIGAEVPAPQHGLYAPADVPLPPTVPDRPIVTSAPPLAPPPVAPEVTPKVDPGSATDTLFQLGSTATETGAKMQAALDITASPKVETGSIDAANAAVQRLLASLAQVGSSAAAAGAAVAAIGGAGARPGPSLASRARGGFTGNGSAIG